MRVSLQTGPVGTGSYLVGHRGAWSDPQDVEVWLLLLFVPIVPLSRWHVSGVPLTSPGPPESVEVTIHSRSRLSGRAALWRLVKAVGVGIGAALPLFFAVSRLGWPWATPLLTTIFGSFVNASVLGKVGAAMEMGLVMAGAALPILVLMHLDERLLRVPIRAAVGLAK